MQLPKRFDPRLLARPWHDSSVGAGSAWPRLAPLAALLTAYHPRLAAEYRALKAESRLLTDQDCIQEGHRGEWARFEITGIWNDPDPNGESDPMRSSEIRPPKKG